MSLLRGGHSWQWQTECYVYQRMALDLREPLGNQCVYRSRVEVAWTDEKEEKREMERCRML